MRSSSFAESLLATVTSRERAASIVGDFTESSRGALWFWSSVLRAGFSLLWKDLAANPGRMMSLALSGAVVNIAFSAPLLASLFAMVGSVAILVGLLFPGHWVISVFFALMEFSFVALSPWLTGRWLARRAPERELAPCLALTMLTAMLWSAAYLVRGRNISLMKGLTGVIPTLVCLLVANLSFCAGAVWARRDVSGPRWFELFPSILTPGPLASTARQRQQKIAELFLAIQLLAPFLVQAFGFPFARGPLDSAIAVVLCGITGRRLFAKSGLNLLLRLWLGIVGTGVLSGWTIWLARH